MLDVDAVFPVLAVCLHLRLGFDGVDHNVNTTAVALSALIGLGVGEVRMHAKWVQVESPWCGVSSAVSLSLASVGECSATTERCGLRSFAHVVEGKRTEMEKVEGIHKESCHSDLGRLNHRTTHLLRVRVHQSLCRG